MYVYFLTFKEFNFLDAQVMPTFSVFFLRMFDSIFHFEKLVLHVFSLL